MNHNKTIQ